MRSAGTAGCATSSSPPPACAWHTWRGRQRKSLRERMMQCSVGEGGLTGRSRARAGLCGTACLASCSHVQPLGLSMTTDTPCADNGIGLLVCTETLPHLQLRLYQLQACSTCRGSCSRASKSVDSEAESPALVHSDASAASAPGAGMRFTARQNANEIAVWSPAQSKTQAVQRRLRCFRTPSFLLLDESACGSKEAAAAA